MDYERLHTFHKCVSYFVMRAKSNTKYRRLYSYANDRDHGLVYDQSGVLTGNNSAKRYPDKLRRIKYVDRKRDKTLIFLTNNTYLPALTIAELYKNRWQVEIRRPQPALCLIIFALIIAEINHLNSVARNHYNGSPKYHKVILWFMYGSMPKPTKRTYSRYSQTASVLLGRLIRAARKKRKFTMQEVADRAGISRGLLRRIENGNLKCEIGVVFEVAAIVGVKLFDADQRTLTKHQHRAEQELELLPMSVRNKTKTVRDDF